MSEKGLDVVDELIIVDTGSTDCKVSVAKNLAVGVAH